MKSWLLKKIKRHSRDANKPFIASGAVLALLSVITFLLFSVSLLKYTLVRHPNLSAVISNVLVNLTNNDRSSFGIESLSVNPKLVSAAQEKANDMAMKGYFSHTSPDGTEPWYWIEVAGYQYSSAGENLAIDFSDSAEVEKAWLASLTHRANLLNGKFTEIGIATARGIYQGRETIFVVQMFGAPKKVFTASISETEVLEIVSSNINTSPPEAEEIEVVSDGAVLSEVDSQVISKKVPWWGYVAASPWTYSRYLYALLGLLIIAATLWTLWFEVRQGHIKHSFYTFALGLAFLIIVYFVNSLLFSEPTLIASSLSWELTRF